jgi:hypothetical protein
LNVEFDRPFLARLRERLSPRTWGLEWIALAAALLGLLSQLWPMSMREQLITRGIYTDATVNAVIRFNQRNQRWGTGRKIGATLTLYLIDLTWRDERGRRQTVTALHVSAPDAVRLGLDAVRAAPAPEHVVPIRFFPVEHPEMLEADRRELELSETDKQESNIAPPCRPRHRCERILIDELNSLNAKKFGDRPEAGLTLVALLVFAAMLAVRAIALLVLG